MKNKINLNTRSKNIRLMAMNLSKENGVHS